MKMSTRMASRLTRMSSICCSGMRCSSWSEKMLKTSKRRVHTSDVLCRQQSNVVNVFDRHTKLLQRERAAKNPDVALFDYIKEEVGYRLADRILDIKKELKVGLDLGCGRGHIAKNITHGTLDYLYMSDMSPSMVESAQVPEDIECKKLVFDEEDKFPLDTKLLDIVISNLNLHWVNNLPGCLREINRVLKKDGVFLASMFGGDTLFELRSSLVLAELEREGGFSPHISPFTEIQDIGALLSSCGFTMLTIDVDEITVGYPSIFELMWDLQGMAENNASIKRKSLIHRDTLLAASAIYQEMYGNKDGIPATFQVIYMIGWKPDPDQVVSQAERGTGQVSLKDLNKLNQMVKEAGMEGRVKFMEELTDESKGKKEMIRTARQFYRYGCHHLQQNRSLAGASTSRQLQRSTQGSCMCSLHTSPAFQSQTPEPGRVRVISIPNPFRWLHNQMEIATLTREWDPNFSLDAFKYGVKHAVSTSTELINRREWGELRGLLSQKAISKVRSIQWTPDQINNLTLVPEKIQVTQIDNVNLQTIVDKKYCDIDVTVIGTREPYNLDKHSLVVLEYFVRFHREYTDGKFPEWTITIFKLKKFEAYQRRTPT